MFGFFIESVQAQFERDERLVNIQRKTQSNWARNMREMGKCNGKIVIIAQTSNQQ